LLNELLLLWRYLLDDRLRLLNHLWRHLLLDELLHGSRLLSGLLDELLNGSLLLDDLGPFL